MNATLKTLAVAFLSVAAAGVMAAPAFAGGDCIKVKGMFFRDEEQVSDCAKAKPYHLVGEKHAANIPVCNDAKSGEHMWGEVNGRKALIRCR